MTQEERVQSHREAVRRHSKKHGNIMIQPLLEDMPRIEAAAKAAGMRKRGFALTAVLEKLEQTPTPPSWIPVGKRLPETDEDVLLYFTEYGYRVGYLTVRKFDGKACMVWYGSDETVYDSYGYEVEAPLPLDAVSHWMPLPEKPGMEGQKNE